MHGPLSEQADDAVLKAAALNEREGSNPSGTTRYGWKLRTYTPEMLQKLAYKSTSVRNMAIKIGLTSGSSSGSLKRLLEKYDIDTQHFTGKTWNRAKLKFSSDEVLCKNSTFCTGYVRKLILKEGRKYECEICGLGSVWQKQSIVLELDHKNGISNDHRPENIRFLCPNCHSQTSNFRGKNRKSSQYVSDIALLEALTSTSSISKALQKVGLALKGGNYKRCYQLLCKGNNG